jgi:hypothetical protein
MHGYNLSFEEPSNKKLIDPNAIAYYENCANVSHMFVYTLSDIIWITFSQQIVFEMPTDWPCDTKYSKLQTCKSYPAFMANSLS